MTIHEDPKYRHVPAVGTAVRSNLTGDLYRIVKDDDELWIQRDIPGSTQRVVATQIHNYSIELRPDLLPPGSMARVAFEVDKMLCEVHPGFPRQKEWLSLTRKVKAAWIEGKIKFKDEHLLRMKLYVAVMKVLQEMEMGDKKDE